MFEEIKNIKKGKKELKSFGLTIGIIILVIFLMIIVAIAFYALTFYKSLLIFFIGSLILGITNAGIRILRTTYLFNYIPNNLIGRATSVFSSLNILVRILLISFFAIPFFNIGDNIRWGYMVGVIMMIISILVVFTNY